jgi:hypothetical protein
MPTRCSVWRRSPPARASFERAQRFYLRVLESDPGDATAQAALINLRAAERHGLVRKPPEDLLASQPDSAACISRWATCTPGRVAGAKRNRSISRPMPLEPDNADHLFNVAVSLDHLRQSKLAAAVLPDGAERR